MGYGEQHDRGIEDSEGDVCLCRQEIEPCAIMQKTNKNLIEKGYTMKKELTKTYDPKGIEDRLYSKWEEKKYFHAEVDKTKKPYTIVIPPPNITGQLHMGHALDNTMQDILIRWKRMLHYRRKISTISSWYSERKNQIM